MKILATAMQRLGVNLALERGRNILDSAREAIDSSQAAQALKRMAGEVADRAFRTTLFRAPISLIVKNYAADALDDEPTEVEREAALRANFEQRVFELRALGADELSKRVDYELSGILSQMSAWGEDVYAVLGDRLAFEDDVPEFISKEFWLRVEKVLLDFGMEWPTGPIGRPTFELAALSSAVTAETGKNGLMPYIGRHVWVGYMYDFFELNRADIEARLNEGDL